VVKLVQETVMAAKKLEVKEFKIERPKPAKLSAEEALKRVQEFAAQRKEQLVAAVRKSKG